MQPPTYILEHWETGSKIDLRQGFDSWVGPRSGPEHAAEIGPPKKPQKNPSR